MIVRRIQLAEGAMVGPGSEWWWDVDVDCGVCSLTIAGVVTAIDILAAQRDLAADQRFDTSYALILDWRMASELRLTWADTRAIVMHHPVLCGSRRALVARTVLGAAMAHAYCAVCEEITESGVVHVCATMREAREWVGAPVDELACQSRANMC
jgi:hypothetical protein